MKRRYWVVGLGLVAALALGTATFKLREAMQPSLHLGACFQTKSGLKPGAEVRVAGVEAGMVQSVTLQSNECPVRVEFSLTLTKYFGSLPRNATARMETGGVLGPTLLEIDLPKVPESALKNHETVKTVEANGQLDPKAAETLKKVIDDAIDRATEKPIEPELGKAGRATQ